MRFLRTTIGDLAEDLQNDHKLPADVVPAFMKSKVVHIVLKTVLNSIMMAVMSLGKKSDATMTVKQEEASYIQFVEDFMNMMFTKGQEPDQIDSGSHDYPNLMLISSLPILMHGSFVSKDMQLKIVEKVSAILEGLDVNSTEVKAYAKKIVADHIVKLNTAPKEKKPPAETKAPKKSMKDTIGRKRVHAVKAAEDQESEDEEDQQVAVQPSVKTVKVAPNTRKTRIQKW